MPARDDSATEGRGSALCRVALIGVRGRLGWSLRRQLAQEPSVVLHAFDRAQINVAVPRLIDEALGPLEFDVLINCVAYTAVDDCEVQSGHASLINGHAAGQMAEICAAKNARMIHFSTDYVFDGTKDGPYVEEDPPNPINVYGRSKRLGELQVLAADARHLVVRLSWLFGPGRPSFPEWVLGQAAAGRVRVIADKIGCPTYSEDVAKWLRPVIFGPSRGGLLHLCNSGSCSWFDYACEVLRLAGSPVRAEAIAMHDLPGLQAKRPVNSALSTAKFESLFGIVCRPWQAALAEYMVHR